MYLTCQIQSLAYQTQSSYVFHSDFSGRKHLVICCRPQRPDNSGRSVSWLNQRAWVNIASFKPRFTALALNLQTHTYKHTHRAERFTLEQVEKSPCMGHFNHRSHLDRIWLALTISTQNDSSRAAVKFFKRVAIPLLGCIVIIVVALPVAGLVRLPLSPLSESLWLDEGEGGHRLNRKIEKLNYRFCEVDENRGGWRILGVADRSYLVMDCLCPT